MKFNKEILANFDGLVIDGEGIISARTEPEANIWISTWKHRSVNIVEKIFGKESLCESRVEK